jgi:hypothetical protein
MRSKISHLLCTLFIHCFKTVDQTPEHALVACRRCPATWNVDFKAHTMERVERSI